MVDRKECSAVARDAAMAYRVVDFKGSTSGIDLNESKLKASRHHIILYSISCVIY